MRKVIGIIPARNQSKRFPGKILATLGGVPLITRVMRSAENSKILSDVYIATDDDQIASITRDYGGKVIMTDSCHKTGTDRIAEAALKIGDSDIVVNIQADEPFLTGDIIDKVVSALDGPDIVMSSACSKIEDNEIINNPNTVKVVFDKDGCALYFSRSRIPSGGFPGGDSAAIYGHFGIYGFKTDFLYKYASLERSPLEISENLEQLRALENGFKIKMVVVDGYFPGINTRDDLINAEKILERKDNRNGG